jgi:hypothetical protein
VQTVIRTATFLSDASAAGLLEDEQAEIVNLIATNPKLGDVMPGTGGARKARVAGRGKGKSGGYRVITYYAGEDVPILLLALVNKGERANLSNAERNSLRQILSHYAEDYRNFASVRREKK